MQNKSIIQLVHQLIASVTCLSRAKLTFLVTIQKNTYRLNGYDELDQPFWGYCVESARVDNSPEILVLMYSSEGQTCAGMLRWMLMSR